MKLTFAPRTRAVRPRWLLEELGVPYELVKVEPSDRVPVLVDGDVEITVSPAICLYLADRFAEKHLAPAPGSAERGHFLQWLLFAEMALEPLVLELYRGEPGQRARLDEVLAIIDRRLEGREFIAGSSFTAADIVMSSILHLANTLKLLEGQPRLFDYVHRHTARPAARRAVQPPS